MKELPTQEEFIYRLLKKGRTISAHEMSAKYGIDRLSAVIYNLRKKGCDIDSYNVVKKSKRFKGHITFSKYFLKNA